MAKEKKKADVATTALDLFFQRLEALTENPVHRRLLKAAQGDEPLASVERELRKIMEEILREA